jgi:MFS family permease
VVLSAALLGIGQALGFPTFTSLAVVDCPPVRRGAAVAVVTAAFDAGYVVAALVLGEISEQAGLRSAFVLAAAVTASATLLFSRGSTSTRCHHEKGTG